MSYGRAFGNPSGDLEWRSSSSLVLVFGRLGRRLPIAAACLPALVVLSCRGYNIFVH